MKTLKKKRLMNFEELKLNKEKTAKVYGGELKPIDYEKYQKGYYC